MLPCDACLNYNICSSQREKQCPSCSWQCTNENNDTSKIVMPQRPAPQAHKGFVNAYAPKTYARVCAKQDHPYPWWKTTCTQFEDKYKMPRRKRLKNAPPVVKKTCPIPPQEPAGDEPPPPMYITDLASTTPEELEKYKLKLGTPPEGTQGVTPAPPPTKPPPTKPPPKEPARPKPAPKQPAAKPKQPPAKPKQPAKRVTR